MFLVVIGFIGLTKPLAAATTGETKHTLNVDLQTNLDARVEHQVELKNTGNTLLESYRLRLPSESFQAQNAKLNGEPLNTIQGDKYLQVNLDSRALRPGATGIIEFNYRLIDFVRQKQEVKLLEFPSFSTSYQLQNFTVHVSAPNAYGQLQYTSQQQAKNKALRFTGNDRILAFWANELSLGIKETIQMDAANNAYNFYHLPITLNNQKVIFTELELGSSKLGSDSVNNYWLATKENTSSKYQAMIVKDQQQFTSLNINYPTLELPSQLAESILPNSTNVQKAEVIHTYLINNYQAAEQTKKVTLEKLQQLSPTKLEAESSLGKQEFAYLFSGFLSSLNVEHQIHYGYLWFANYPNFNKKSPHIWIEVPRNNQSLQVFDPYLELKSGMQQMGVSNLNRTSFGIWDPANEFDNALGLLTHSGVRPRPEPANSPNPQVAAAKPELTLKNPATAYSFTGNSITLQVSNPGLVPLSLNTGTWDDFGFTDQLKITPEVVEAVPPQATWTKQINNLVWPYPIYDGEVAHNVTLTRREEKLPLTASYTVLYIPSPYVTGSLVVIFVSIFAFVIIYNLRNVVLERRSHKKPKKEVTVENSSTNQRKEVIRAKDI